MNLNNSLDEQVLDPADLRVANTPGLSGWSEFTDAIGHLILPTIVLAMSSYASWSRFQRASMLDVLNSDYLRLAKAKGLSRRKVMVRHGLRTALIPLTTQVTLDVAAILGGAVLTETVFGWQGMGSMLINGINNQDTNVVLAWLVVAAIVVIVFNLIADLLYAVLDPRIRLA
jgi:peptide/nickel transport system permease protein